MFKSSIITALAALAFAGPASAQQFYVTITEGYQQHDRRYERRDRVDRERDYRYRFDENRYDDRRRGHREVYGDHHRRGNAYGHNKHYHGHAKHRHPGGDRAHYHDRRGRVVYVHQFRGW